MPNGDDNDREDDMDAMAGINADELIDKEATPLFDRAAVYEPTRFYLNSKQAVFDIVRRKTPHFVPKWMRK